MKMCLITASYLLMFSASVLANQPASVEEIMATADTFVQRSNPTVNFSSETRMPIKRVSDDDYAEVYFEFDLRAYANRQITHAVLGFGVDRYDVTPSNANGCAVKGVRLLPAMDLSTVAFDNLRLPVEQGSTLSPLKSYRYPLLQTFLMSPAGAGECLTANRATVIPVQYNGQNAANVFVNLGEGLNGSAGHRIVLSVEEFRPVNETKIYSMESAFPLKPTLMLTLAPPSHGVVEANMTGEKLEQCPADTFLKNPLTSLYKWRGNELNPNAAPSPDQYERFNWNQLETTEGNYEGIDKYLISPIENLIPGQKFAFRVRAMESEGNVMPAYLATTPSAVQTCDDGAGVPAWSNAKVKERAAALVMAIRNRISELGYMDRIAWIDLAFVGRWGEGNSGCTSKMKNSDRQHYVNMYTDAFASDSVQFVVVSDNEKMLMNALSKDYYPPIGIRRDSLGIERMRFDEFAWQYNSWPLVANRWKQAPLITEFGGGTVNRHRSMWAISPAEVAQWHITAIGNGNTTSDQPSNPCNPAAPPSIAVHCETFNHLARSTGARLHLSSVEYPSEINVGKPFSFYTNWLNLGNAPVYEPYSAEIIFVDGNGNQHVQTLGLNPKTILPTHNPITGVTEAYRRSDILTLPNNGKFQTYIRLRDARTNWPRKPLALCQAAAPDTNIDGAYYIGELNAEGLIRD